ncbi:MAG: sugar phosphate isomerase/epimerase family protein, partial [Acutalibacter sp.]
MKLGCCASLWEDMILKLPAAGADYAEAGFSSLMGKSLDQVRARAAQLEKAGVSLESMNVLFPGDFRLTGPQADFSAVDSYLEENLPKAQALGVKVVVFGSGGARRVPEGFPQEEAFAQLVELCREHIVPAAAAHGITCCVEPLNQKETNILTTSGECFRLVEAVNHPNLQLLVDLYHFDLEDESLSALEGYRGRLGHCHIASAQNSRLVPQPWDGQDYLPFFQALAAMGYEAPLRRATPGRPAPDSLLVGVPAPAHRPGGPVSTGRQRDEILHRLRPAKRPPGAAAGPAPQGRRVGAHLRLDRLSPHAPQPGHPPHYGGAGVSRGEGCGRGHPPLAPGEGHP